MAVGARLTYHVQGIASGCGRDAELALLLSRSHTADARAATESPGCEFGGHCEGSGGCVGGRDSLVVVVVLTWGALGTCLSEVSSHLIGSALVSTTSSTCHGTSLNSTIFYCG